MTASKLDVHTSRINEFIQILGKNPPTFCCKVYNRVYCVSCGDDEDFKKDRSALS